MNQKEHLLHLCSYSYESGGPASVILNHSRFQIESGMDVTIASSIIHIQPLRVSNWKYLIRVLFPEFSPNSHGPCCSGLFENEVLFNTCTSMVSGILVRFYLS
jgi:hypothetical protein